MCIVQGSDSLVIKLSIAGILYIRELMEGYVNRFVGKRKKSIKEMVDLNKQGLQNQLEPKPERMLCLKIGLCELKP